MSEKRTPYQERFAPSKGRKAVSKVIPKPQLTGKECKRPGCENPALGDAYCSKKCCELDHKLPPHTTRPYERKI